MSQPAGREILFLAHRIPFPPDRGDKIRSFNIVKRLSEIAPVHLAAFADNAADAANLAGLVEVLGGRLASSHVEVSPRSKAACLLASFRSGRSASVEAFASPTMHSHVAELLARGRIRTIFAFSGQMGQYIPASIGEIRFVMDFVDVDSAKFESYAGETRVPFSLLYRREARLLAGEEAQIARRADVSLFVTQAEAELFRTRAGGCARDVRALENGVDLDYFSPTAAFKPLARQGAEPLLVFTGQMDYDPNVQAVFHFAKSVLPRIRQHSPAARFAIVGRNPTALVNALTEFPGVEVIGAVPDVRPWLAAADVVVAPLRIARGVQNKVLEAMAMARPVVASSAAFEGIDASPETDLVVVDDPGPTAKFISVLIDARSLRDEFGENARARMCARYAWDRQLAGLPELVSG